MSTSVLASMAVVLNGEISGFKKAMATAKKEMRDVVKVGESMKDVGKSLSLYVTAPLALMGGVAVQAWDKQAKAMAQVENGLRSTGNAAKLTMDQLTKAASDLQNKTLFGDEEILQGATTQLLTFTNIAGEQFLRTQEAALNLATKLDGDLKSASIQLGKALNDPVKNLSALSRSGIQFSEDQKKMINALAQTGRMAEAQTLILDELEKQYGGTAEAAAKAGTGGLKQLQNTLGDIMEEFGAIVYEGIAPVVEWLKKLAASFQGLSAETKKTIVIIAALVAGIGPLLAIFGAILTTLPLMVAGWAMLAKAAAAAWAAILGPVGLVIAGLAAVAGGVYLLSKAFPTLEEKSKRATKALQEQTDTLKKLNTDIKPLLSRYEELKNKTNRTAAEQEELNKIVKKIALAVPGATTVVDQYGNAVEISTGKVKDFIKENANMEQALRQKALAAKTREIEEYERKLAGLEKTAAKGKKTFSSGVGGNLSGGTSEVQLTTADYKKLGEEAEKTEAKLKQLREERRKLFLEGNAGMGPIIDTDKVEADAAKTIGIIQGLQDKLSALQEKKPGITDTGELAAVNQQIKALQEQIKHYEELGTAQNKQAEILKNLQTEFDEAGKRAQVFGNYEQEAANKAKLLESAISSLISNGFSPQSAAIRDLKAQYDGLNNIDLSPLQNTFEAFATATGTALDTFKEKVKGVQLATSDAVQKLSDSLVVGVDVAQMVASAAMEAMDLLGQSIGQALSGQADAFGGFFQSIMGVVADFMSSFGKALISAGIAALAFEQLLANPIAAIAAGSALVLASGVVKGILSKGVKGGATSSVGGGGIQQPRYNPSNSANNSQTLRFELEGAKLVAVADAYNSRNRRIK